ncbi:MAG TPA: DoxX family protein [Candidatus Acidoferrales bacterium]|nr:DoxX family protein [Candidatus Acidoferrales bacterium]
MEKLKPLASLVLRLGLAIVFFYHGYPKLAHRREWFAAFPRMGFPWYFAYIAGTLETVGSCLLAVGLLTRLVALLLAGEMAIALWQVHMAKGILAVGFYQLPLMLAVGSFALMTMGGGAISLDRVIFKGNA